MLAIIGAAVLVIIAYLFAEKRKEEIKLNTAKIPEQVRQWESLVVAASREFDVPATIAMSVLWVESAGSANARGSAGEIGLMQLKKIAVNDLAIQGFGKFTGWQTDPQQNIRAGVAYLRLQYNRTGNWFDAVEAYNQGFEGRKKNPEKAQAYLNEVREKEKFFG